MVRARVPWANSFWTNLQYFIIIQVNSDVYMLTVILLLTVMDFSLVFFLFQIIFLISLNKTQIEVAKLRHINSIRKQRGINTRVKNFYDRGFLQNWKECLFPPKIDKRRPRSWDDFAPENAPQESDTTALQQ